MLKLKSQLTHVHITRKYTRITFYYHVTIPFDFIRTKLVSNVFVHFNEMRFQIDEQGEELKKKIVHIALVMIDRTKKIQ